MTNTPAERKVRCLRCKTVELVLLDSPEGISFFQCPKCHRQNARESGKGLAFRWLHPISLYLYPVILERNPVQYFEKNKSAFAPRANATAESLKNEKVALQEIMLELNDPTQQVRDIIGCLASEEELRKYLRCVADLLKKRVNPH